MSPAPADPASPRHPAPARAGPLGLRRALSALLLLFPLAVVVPAFAQSLSPGFSPAQPGRTHMDIGGVWNGSAEVTSTTGDTFTLVVANNATPRYEFALSIALPTHFQYVPGTATAIDSCGALVPAVTASVDMANNLVFTFPAGYDLGPDCTLTVNYGLRVLSSMPSSGTYQLQINTLHATTNGGIANQAVNTTQNILVLQGASNLSKTPTDQLRAVNQTASFTVTVVNTGLGALWDVTINESLINPGGNLALLSMTKTAPARPATGSSPVLTMPYLAPGEAYVVEVTATVTSCGNILNTVSTTDRTGITAKSANAPVVLDLQQPLIVYSPPSPALSYAGPVPVSFNVQNTGGGAANAVVLSTNLHTLGLSVTNVAPGWSYAAGVFTRTGGTPAGTIPNLGSVVLSYDLEPLDYCAGSPGGTVIWNSSYTNPCGDLYSTPTYVSSVAPPTNSPSVSVSHSVSSSRLANGEAGAFNLSFNATQTGFIAGANFTVTANLPAGLSGVTLSPSTGSASLVGNTVTWTLAKVAPTTNATLTISFLAQGDPCLAGSQYTSTSSVSATSTRGCPLSSNASATFLLTNNPGASAFQYFDVSPPPDGVYETGHPSADAVRDLALGEGEFIPFEAAYSFGPGYAGFWTGSTYLDNFAGVASQTLVPGTLEYSVNGGATWNPVPGPSVSGGTGSLTVNLSFLKDAAFGGDDLVSGRSLSLRYRTTISDAGLLGNNTRGLLQQTDLSISGTSGDGACTVAGSNFRQGAFFTIARAAATLGLDLPSQIAICQVVDVTLTVGNATAKPARNLLLTLNTSASQYTYLTGAEQTVTYGGAFNSGNMVYAENGGVNPTWTFTPATLPGSGTITFRVRLKATAPLTPSTLGATVAYDDLQTSVTPPPLREFSASGSDSPFLVRKAGLSLTVTPDTVVVVGNLIQWKIYLTNGGDGPAYNAVLRNTLHPSLQVEVAQTNAANPGYPVQVSGPNNEFLVWNLGDIPAGVTRLITVVIDIGASSTNCFIPTGQNTIVGEWGCGGDLYQTITRISPNYSFPAGQMLVAHDTTQSEAFQCQQGTIVFIVRNTGPTEIFGITAREVLDPVASGLSLVPGTVQYSVDGGATWLAGGNPTGTGTAGNPYTWTSTQIPPYANLKPSGGGSPQEVRLRFGITANDSFSTAGSIGALASATGNIACGNLVNSPGTTSNIPTRRPVVSMAKTGRNITANPAGPFVETVYGGVGDAVEWRLFIRNTGNATAEHVRISDVLSGSAGSAVINGPGLAPNTPFTPGLVLSVPNLAPGADATYTISETLGGNCLVGSRDADVSWGCASQGANTRSTLTAPGTPVDPAVINMIPSVVEGVQLTQSLTSLPGGRALVTVSFTNNGGTLYAPVLTATIPAYATHDTTGPVTLVTASPDINAVSRTGGTDNAPVFTFTGAAAPHFLRFGETLSFSYYVRPTVFDTTEATTFPELAAAEPNPALDPNPPTPANLTASLAYTSSCGGPFTSTHNTLLTLLRPDLDITAGSPASAILSFATTQNYNFTVTNVGPLGSVADRITLTLPNLGAGWQVQYIRLTTPGTGGIANADAVLDGGTYTFFPATVGTLASNQSAVVSAQLTYNPAVLVGPLTIRLRARGESRTHDGNTVTGNYSLDQRGLRVLGVEVAKVLQASSEVTSSGTQVFNGEDLTYRITVRIRGAEGEVSNIRIRDQLRRGTATNSDTDNFGFVRVGASPFVTTGPEHNAGAITLAAATNNAETNAVVTSGRLDFAIPNLDPGATTTATGAVTQFDLVARVMNIPANSDGVTLTNRLGLWFDYLGARYHPLTANTYSGLQALGSTGTGVASLYQSHVVTVRRPSFSIAKTVRNLTRGGAFASNVAGEAGDVLEYRLVLTNSSASGDRPLRSIRLTDTVPSKLNLSAADQGADTNNNPNNLEVLNTGGASGPGATILFNQTNTPIPTSGQNFDQLNHGQSITLLYRGTLLASVVPNEVLSNSASLVAFSIPVDDANLALNQVAMKSAAAPGNPDNPTRAAARYYDATASAATVVIDPITQEKILLATSEPATPQDTSPTPVVIGEQVRFRVSLTLPQGTVPNLVVTDTLPAGMAFIGTPSVVIGADIAAANNPPLFSLVGQTATWSFGQTLTSGPANTVTIDYLTQVRNVAGNVAGTSLANNATYSYTGAPINLNQFTLVVREPAVAVTHQVRNLTKGSAFAATATADAGDVIEYRVALSNPAAANRSPAFDLAFSDTLPAGLSYVPGSTVPIVDSGLIGTLSQPDVAGQVLTWGRTQATPVNLDLAIGSNNFEFRYQATVDDSSAPLQVYTNALNVNWTSLDGDPIVNPILAPENIPLAAPGEALGERIGTGVSPNLYRATPTTTVTAVNSTTLAKVKAGDTLPLDAPGSGFRVGDLVTYTLTLVVQEGTLAAFTVNDTLPAGLAFEDTESITPLSGADGFVYTAPVAPATAPAPGATGAIAWQFGPLLNTGDNDDTNNTLTVVYRARVLDPGGIAPTPTNQTLTNSSTVSYTLANSATHTSPASLAPVVARQPRLTLLKEVLSPALDALGYYVRRPGDTASFRLTVTNTGTAPAYNLALTDTLPPGMRQTGPILSAASLNGDDVLATLSPPAWNNLTGTWSFALADSEYILPGQTLVLTYTVTVDNDDALKGTTLTNSAQVDAFYSLPTGDPQAASRRQYAVVGPATRDLVIGLRIDGQVYHDLQPNGLRDLGEDWAGLRPTVYANLVTPGPGSFVFRTVTVPAGPGDFAFDYLPPGNFTIVITDGAGNLVAQRPANWLFQVPAGGSLPVTLSQVTGDLVEQDFGLNQGPYDPALAPVISKDHTGETLPLSAPGDAFRVGDLVTYTVDLFPHEGTHSSFAVSDLLPAGLAFHDTVSIAQVSGPARFTFTTPAGPNTPAAGAEGAITWTFGAFTNAIADPAHNTLRITYRARVIHTGTSPLPIPGPAPASTSSPPLPNAATIGYQNPSVSPLPLAAGPAVSAVAVEQPRLSISKILSSPALNRLPPGGTGTFTVTVDNSGTAPAYNIVLRDTFPVGLRGTPPVLTSATLNGADALAALTPNTSWNPAAGLYTCTLSDSQVLLPGQSLVLTYQFTVDLTAPRATPLNNSAQVDVYHSKPSSDPAHRRPYPVVGPVSAPITVGLRIEGTVYHDLDLNLALDPGEDWTGPSKPTLYVNLIESGVVVESATVAPGPGTFSFTNLPAADYTLVVATTPTALVSDRPANWLYGAPSDGTYALPGTADDVLQRNFGFNQGSLAAAILNKAESGQTLPLDLPGLAFRIGDLITYTVDIQPQEGAFTDFVVTDQLPAGLAFVQTLSIAQVSGPARFTFTTPTGANAPAADATGTITWTFGSFANALLGPADNTLRLVYTARVLDPGGVAVPPGAPAPTSVTLLNAAQLSYLNQDLLALGAGPASASALIEQPRLTLAKDRLAPAAYNVARPGQAVTFRLTATNDGSAPAYNTVLEDTLPLGMRVTTPVVLSVLLNGAPHVPAIPPTYDSLSGVWTLSLDDPAILLPGQSLIVDYTVQLDLTAPLGQTLTNSARVPQFASREGADPTHRRVYPEVGPATQSIIVGLEVSGSVYEDILAPYGLKGAGEDWADGVPVHINLVAAGPVVLRSAPVNPGNGQYLLPDVPPGSYQIVLSNHPLSTVPTVPAGWVFRNPLAGSLNLNVTNFDLADQDFGLYRPRTIAGTVFDDVAPYGTREAETWATGTAVVVNLVDTLLETVVASSAVNPGPGTFLFTGVAPGQYRLVVATNPAATTASPPALWVFTGPVTGTRTFAVTTSDYADQDFGLALGRSISGFVYNDINPNSAKDAFESWATGVPVVVNLVNLSNFTVIQSQPVNPGAGDYTFNLVPPGTYRLVVNTSPLATTAQAPPSWFFRAPPDGTRVLTVSTFDYLDQNFGLYLGTTIAGRVFEDNGAGGGVAHDGFQNGSEGGIPGVVVRLTDGGAMVYDQAITNGQGDFLLSIPTTLPDGTFLVVEEFNPAGFLSVSGHSGDTGGSYHRPTDRVSFNLNTAVNYTGLRFGDVRLPQLLTDGTQTVLPGATAHYSHTFIAFTTGQVTFSLSMIESPPIPGWGTVLYLDSNGNGILDPGEPAITAPISVTAGQNLHLIVKDFSPAGAGYGAQHQITLTALFSYSAVLPALSTTLTRQDLTIVGQPQQAGLSLVKVADKAQALPGESITYTITYTNLSAAQLENIVIFDQTPAFTTHLAASFGPLPPQLTGCTISTPAIGAYGNLSWAFSGKLDSGASGTVSYSVKIND